MSCKSDRDWKVHVVEVTRIKKDEVVVNAYAKINLYLDITGKLENGYHTLDMIMQSVGIYDVITVKKTKTKKIGLSCSDKWIPTNDKNIAVKCAVKFFEFIGLNNEGIHIDIKKEIPQQAGMAGGSADGAGVIAALDFLYGTKLPIKTLCQIGKEVGADIPFCLTGGTALVQGIGDIITRLPKLKNVPLVIIKPKAGINTKAAYDQFDDNLAKNNGTSIDTHTSVTTMQNVIIEKDVTKICDNLYNVFESVNNLSIIQKAKLNLIENGAIGSLMTGSGSAVFGIFADRESAQKCYDELKELYPVCFLTRTR